MAEKTVNDLTREVRLLYTRGTDAFQREIYDYAIDLFNQVLIKEPGLYECRRALRNAQLRKASGSGFLKKMWGSASSAPLIAKGQMALRKDPAEALQIAEHILNSDPNNSAAHRMVVEAATALDMPKTAVLSLEILLRNSPKDKDVAIDFANKLADTGDVVRAENVLAELSAATPGDNDLAQALKNISARKTMDKGGYEAASEGKGTYRDILKDKDEAVALERENRQVKTEDTAQRLIEDYELRLKTDPQNIKLLRNLAELYTEKKQFDRALSYYERIKASENSGDSGLDRGIAETNLRKLDHQISQIDPNAADFAEQTAKLQTERAAYQLAECQKRVERFPTDLQIRFELGQLYFQAGKIKEAMTEFQKAQANPHRRVQSLNYLGQCFAKRGIHDIAISKLEEAIKEKPAFDDEKKDLVYNLGTVYEKMGKRDDAIAQFKQIYAVDVDYRDVAEKIDAFYGRA
jgi:tetratricopeptide (TPR) repeat protein